MSKIQKFLKSALYNSNANEAAQALKLAASTMQSEGLNPSDFLERKGENSHFAELAELRNQHAYLMQSLQAAQSRVRQLENEIGELRRAGNSSASLAADLREAKEQAIKWYRRSELNELQLKELAPVAVAAQEKVIQLEKALQNQKGTIAGTLGWMLFAAVVVGVMTHLVTKKSSYERGYGVGRFEGIIQGEKHAKDASPADNDVRPVPPGLWLPQNGIYDMEALCQSKKGSVRATFRINMNERIAKETTHLFNESLNLGLPGEGAVPIGYKFYITLVKSAEKKLCTVKKVW